MSKSPPLLPSHYLLTLFSLSFLLSPHSLLTPHRFWGTPIPLWISDDLEEMVAVGSVQELFELSGVRATDLHKENIDPITIPSKQGKGVLRRVDEVFDCWFESGSMPYAQLHYPFENQDRFDKGFPADFIAEGLDQTRGWFYTLMVISTALFDKPAFKNLIVNGLVLAEDGQKMSKRKKNYPAPEKVLDLYGADALRLYLINSPVVRADKLLFSETGVNEVVRGVLLPWFNAFRFFIQCVEQWEQRAENSGKSFAPDTEVARSSTNDVDVWIMAATLGLVEFVHQEMKAYRLYTVVPRLVDFIEQLTNWYVRLNRDRIKGSAGPTECLLGLNVLYEVLLTVSIIMSPFTPFFAEYLYQHLRKLHPNYSATAKASSSVAVDAVGKADSVHFLMLPSPDPARMNPTAEARFQTLQEAVVLARAARDRRHIRNNLPLKDVIVVAANERDVEALTYLKSYFMSEINAWNVTLSTDWVKLCVLKIIPDFGRLGKRLGKQMKEVQKAISELTQEQAAAFMESGSINICGFEMSKEDLVVKRDFSGDTKKYEAAVSADGSLMVAIDTTCDEEILQELRARSLAAVVQKLRKSSGLQVGDRVEIFYEEKDAKMSPIGAAVKAHAASTVARLKSMPLPLSLLPPHCLILGEETIKDADISKSPFRLVLTAPALAVDTSAFGEQLDKSTVQSAVMYLQTLSYERALEREKIEFSVDGTALVCTRGVHYYASSQDLFTAKAQM